MRRCEQCDGLAERSLCGVPYCETCREVILAPIRVEVNGRGRPDGFSGVGRAMRAAPESGPGRYSLQCDVCGATWTGLVGEACGWCDRLYEVTVQHQAEILLSPDLPDGGPRFDAAVSAWMERLAVAVKAGIVDPDAARRAVERTEVRHAA